jgi:hypothetical protein
MDIELFKIEMLEIRARGRKADETAAGIFACIRLILRQLEGVAVSPEFKRALREELDRAWRDLQGTSSR